MSRFAATITRTWAMIVKELWAVLRDPRGRIILVVPPVIQLLLFASAATLEVKNVAVGIYNRDAGQASAEFIQQMRGSPNFKNIVMLHSAQDLRAALNHQNIIVGVMFDVDFSRNVNAHRPATVLAVFDGRRSNAAQIVSGYLSVIAGNVGAVIRPQKATGGQTIVRHMFNPNLDFLMFMLPVLVAQVAGISAMSVTVQSVARERELGSFDQLMVSPLRLYEILIGKMTPPLLVGMFNATLYLLIITFYFGEPVRGSVIMYFISLVFYLNANIGIGMMVSSIAQTQQQAFLGMFLITVPISLLSGFSAPVDNMPVFFQILAQADPQMHMVVIMEGLFLKAMPVADVLANCIPLILISAVTLTAATLMFRSRVE
jgi:ABC-2 type transport system permease protein